MLHLSFLSCPLVALVDPSGWLPLPSGMHRERGCESAVEGRKCPHRSRCPPVGGVGGTKAETHAIYRRLHVEHAVITVAVAVPVVSDHGWLLSGNAHFRPRITRLEDIIVLELSLAGGGDSMTLKLLCDYKYRTGPTQTENKNTSISKHLLTSDPRASCATFITVRTPTRMDPRPAGNTARAWTPKLCRLPPSA